MQQVDDSSKFTPRVSIRAFWGLDHQPYSNSSIKTTHSLACNHHFIRTDRTSTKFQFMKGDLSFELEFNPGKETAAGHYRKSHQETCMKHTHLRIINAISETALAQ